MGENSKRSSLTVSPGVHAYVVTPVGEHGTLLRDSHELVVESVVGAGCAGVTVLGATGELPYVSEELRADLISSTVSIVNDRAAVIAGVGGFTSSEIVKQAIVAEDLGADGVLVMLQGFLRLSSADQTALFNELSSRINLPIVVYVNPPLCNVDFDIDTLQEIAKAPTVVGIKDATGRLDSFEAATAFAEQGVSLFTATATPLTAAFLLGASGWMSGTATLFPSMCQQFYEACHRGDWVEASSIEQRLSRALGAFRSTGPAVVKALLNAKGVNVGNPLGPNRPIPEPQAQQILQDINRVINGERS